MKTYRGLRLDRFQQEACSAIRAGHSVVVAAPTGCGKTLVAEYAIERALLLNERVIYTAPIKALSNQKFRDFGALYGDRVGIMTGDVTLNPGADALIMTTEIFRNTIFDNPERLAGIRYVIHDEIHYLDDPDRGTVWEESIMFAPDPIRFVFLSATISNLDQFAGWIREIRPGKLRVVVEEERPVPLDVSVFTGSEFIPVEKIRGAQFPGPRVRGGRRGRRRSFGPRYMHQTLDMLRKIVEMGQIPAIGFIFSRAFVERYAVGCLDLNLQLLTPEERDQLKAIWKSLSAEFELDETDTATARLRRLLIRGIAFHHAGMLPTNKEIVERLFTSGLIKVLFATETFALGVNMPARSVFFETLKKYDGIKRDYMRTRSFMQMSGRAGRRGIDDRGFVYANVLASEDQPAGVRRVVLGKPELVDSQFNLSYATLLNLYSRLGDEIIEACQRSFAYYRHRKHKRSPFADMVALVRRRIRCLQEEGYLEGQALTPKGRFASVVYGYEIHLSELYMGGLLDTLEPAELAVVLVAIVHEARRDEEYTQLARTVQKPLQESTERLLRGFMTRETELKLPGLKKLDWCLARAAWEWAEGASFEQIRTFNSAAAGDIVRSFRMAIQQLRQLGKPLALPAFSGPQYADFKALLSETMTKLRRDVIDAERQLRQSVHAEQQDPARRRSLEGLDDLGDDDEDDALGDEAYEDSAEPVDRTPIPTKPVSEQDDDGAAFSAGIW